MKLIIEIPDKEYEFIMKSGGLQGVIWDAIRAGTIFNEESDNTNINAGDSPFYTSKDPLD